MDVKIFRINYKSDFILTLNSDAGWMTPFCIKFWTGAPSQAYFVGWDGETYTHCAYDPTEPTKLLVQFDDHHLPIGDLKFQIAYHFTVADFPDDTEDEVINPASIIVEIDGEQYQVMLDFTGETAPEIAFSLPAYANEAQRIANEQQRIIAEEQRIANEQTRITAEATRQQNEEQRIQQESMRVRVFAQLKQESEQATDDANAAASLANEKAQLAADKAALADDAAALANQKAQLATDKAALADDAAALANQKAQLAAEKAALAQQKADYAQTQGSYAKTQGDYAKAQGDTALADHERAETDHVTAVADHTTATGDHAQMTRLVNRADVDHTQAVTDHSTAQSDHSRAATDHATATADHTQAVTDHTTADNDHTRAESDHQQAVDDHETAVEDHDAYATSVLAAQTAAQNAAVSAETSAQQAAAAADSAAETEQYVEDLKDAIEALPDGQAVSAQVAQNTVAIANLQETSSLHTEQIADLQDIVQDLETVAEGYVRVAGSSSPALSYKSYKYHEQGGFGRESVFSLFYPCLVGTKLTGDDSQVGKILHILQKLDFEHDIYGNARKIDGSEGDVMIVNIEPYYRIIGKHTIEGREYDVFLVSRTPFTWQGIEAQMVEKGGVSPDYTVSHLDSDNVRRMHSVYNPAWNGDYTAPAGVVGKYVYSQDGEGVISETYDENATLLGGAGGCHTTSKALYTGEQESMNMNPDTTKTVPFMNQTAACVENWFSVMLAEGGTFDAHNATLMGSGFCANDPATNAADWEEGATGAKNGIRIYDKNGTPKMYSPSANALNTIGLAGAGSNLFGAIVNSFRNPFKVMEAHRAVSYAVRNGVHELEWFVFEGNKYKYRSVAGFNGPAQGEMTCVVWKMLSAKLGAGCFDPTDKTTSIEGNRIDLMFSVALFHGITTQVSPGWWTSGLVFTQDDNGDYRAFYQPEQESLLVTPTGEIAASALFNFEESYEQVGPVISKGSGYRKDYLNGVLPLPDTNVNKAGGGLHTYVGAYNYYSGGNATSGKKLVRGFLRGSGVFNPNLSPLFVAANFAPSGASAYIGFGTCCRITE